MSCRAGRMPSVCARAVVSGSAPFPGARAGVVKARQVSFGGMCALRRGTLWLRGGMIACVAVLVACGPSPHEAGLTWNGKLLRVVERQDAPPRDSLLTQGWEALVNHAPRRILRVEPGEWGDSLWLLEFEDPRQAYVAYQQVSPEVASLTTGETV